MPASMRTLKDRLQAGINITTTRLRSCWRRWLNRESRWTAQNMFLLREHLDEIDKFMVLQLTVCRYLLVASGAALATVMTALSQGWGKGDFSRSLLAGAPLFLRALSCAIVSMAAYTASRIRLGILKFHFHHEGYVARTRRDWRKVFLLGMFANLIALGGTAFLIRGLIVTLNHLRLAAGMTPANGLLLNWLF